MPGKQGSETRYVTKENVRKIVKGWSGRGQYDKNEEKEFHYSMKNVGSQRIWMQSLEFSIPACGSRRGGSEQDFL